MKDWKHIVFVINQDDTLDEIVARLNNISNSEGKLYCAEVFLNFFNKTKEEICPEDDIPPYELEKRRLAKEKNR